MSAMTETTPGGTMVCIREFSARPRDEANVPTSGDRKTFRVGEAVRFLGSLRKETPADNPTGPMAIFEPLEPARRERYAARAGYFVDADCWAGIKDYFASRFRVIDLKLEFVETPGTTAPGKNSRRPRSRAMEAE